MYVSFSGGKDSTVLLDIVKGMYPDVPAVFCDTGLEYPEVRELALRKAVLAFRAYLDRTRAPVRVCKSGDMLILVREAVER